jgi:hypothetical protein
MPRIGRRRAQRADRHEHAQWSVRPCWKRIVEAMVTRFADQADALGHASRLCDGGGGGYDVADLMRMKKKI